MENFNKLAPTSLTAIRQSFHLIWPCTFRYIRPHYTAMMTTATLPKLTVSFKCPISVVQMMIDGAWTLCSVWIRNKFIHNKFFGFLNLVTQNKTHFLHYIQCKLRGLLFCITQLCFFLFSSCPPATLSMIRSGYNTEHFISQTFYLSRTWR